MRPRQRAARPAANHAKVLRIACWSGPRNIATPLMRAWQNRGDTAVLDEPLYAHYLVETGLEHPGREDVIASGQCDWRAVVAMLGGPAPKGAAIWYQKHMAHHLLPHIARKWLDSLVNCLLIRDPFEMLLSYAKTRHPDGPEDLGYPQQSEIFEHVCERTDAVPIVIDTGDFLRAPEALLRAWCERLGVAFSDSMLRGPAIPRGNEGAWMANGNGSEERGNGFGTYRPPQQSLPAALQPLLDACLPHYHKLHEHRLRVPD